MILMKNYIYAKNMLVLNRLTLYHTILFANNPFKNSSFSLLLFIVDALPAPNFLLTNNL